MDATQSPSSKKRVRSSQACQSCRSLKVGCLPSSQVGICQRCFDFKRRCLWTEAEHRDKKHRGPSRLAQVERKLDGLVARFTEDRIPAQAHPLIEIATSSNLHFQVRQQSQSSTSPNSASRVPECQPVAGLDHVALLNELANIHDFDVQNTCASNSNTHAAEVRRYDALVDDLKDLLAGADANSLLDIYRSMSTSFPFVPIAPSLSVDELRKSKPILLLAVMSAASWKDRELQVALEERYRHEIANRALVEPRKSVTLVQSMLVYLSWYHFYFNHKIQNIYPVLHMLIGIAMDLGLHQISKPSPFLNKLKAQFSPEQEHEEQRTLLGCYYLSSAISNALKKPNLFQYTKYMSECLERLRNDLELISDGTLSSLVDSRRLEDQLVENCYSVSLDVQCLPILAEIQRRLVELGESAEGNGIKRLNGLLLHYSTMNLYNFRPQVEAMSMVKADLHSRKQLEAVQSMTDAGRSFLDILIHCPVSDYSLISFVEWIRLPQVILTMSKLLFYTKHDFSQSDLKAIQDRVRLDLYLESLCYRMQTLTTFKPPNQPRLDFWIAMKVIMDQMRESYTRHVCQGKFAGRSEIASEIIDQDLTRGSSQQVPGNAQAVLPPDFAFTGMPADPGSANDNNAVPFMPEMDFNLDEFMEVDFWGGPGSYDPTIE